MDSVYFCADMDAFFASVEQHDNPDYMGNRLLSGDLRATGVWFQLVPTKQESMESTLQCLQPPPIDCALTEFLFR